MDSTYNPDDMAAAIAAGVEALTEYMDEHGEQARRRLGAKGRQGFVTFGTKSGGGFYRAVFLHHNGICSESGTGGSYNRTTTPPVRSTPQEAVEMFARHGAGWQNPDRVRNIVTWLTERIEMIEKN